VDCCGELPAGQAAVEAVSGGRSCGAEHRNAGRNSNRAHDKKFRQQVLRQVREKYGGAVASALGRRWRPEHLASGTG